MRYLILIVALIAVSKLDAQQPLQQNPITGIVVSNDSLPVSDVAIVNMRTGKTVRTNIAGFFKTELADGDSLFVYHIAYKKKYISRKDNGKLIVLEPEIQQIKQVDITDKSKQEEKNLAATMKDIMRLAPMKGLTGYELHSRMDYFVLENSSSTRGFSPFFGPTAHIPLAKITGLVIKSPEQKERKKLMSHYKIVKKKKKKAGQEAPIEEN